MADKKAESIVERPLAEVISASIMAVSAEAVTTHGAAPNVGPRAQFGSFVKIVSPENSIDIYAVVYDVITGPPDNVHKPAALGMSRDQLRLEQPHIFSLLKTHLQAAIVGYGQVSESTSRNRNKTRDAALFQHLPPQPPQVHDFVYLAAPEQILALTADFDFLNLLTHVTAVPTDELIAAALRQAAGARRSSGGNLDEDNNDHEVAYLLEAGRAISQLFRSDYDRMVSIIKKIRPQPG
ncbi:MAG: hypothetical protein KGS72_18760 [Cyanobacteria bacterium REEB67]|nr:hypothetical protein [Cyanobacteria bacterium REEB67]